MYMLLCVCLLLYKDGVDHMVNKGRDWDFETGTERTSAAMTAGSADV